MRDETLATVLQYSRGLLSPQCSQDTLTVNVCVLASIPMYGDGVELNMKGAE